MGLPLLSVVSFGFLPLAVGGMLALLNEGLKKRQLKCSGDEVTLLEGG